MNIKSIINETLPSELKKEFCFAIIADFKFKKLQIDKKLEDIENKKIPEIKKKLKKSKSKARIFFDNKYVGEVDKNGMPIGAASILFNSQPDQDIFQGEFKYGLKHGLGTYTYFNRSDDSIGRFPFTIPYYLGEWFADFTHGVGKKLITQFENLASYEGNFVCDKMNGFGTYKYFNSDNQDISNREIIGYFFDETPHIFTVEINRDDKGVLEEDSNLPSGLFENYPEHNVKIPILNFNNVSEWDNIKPIEIKKKEFKKIFNDSYYSYFEKDIFSKKYEKLIFEIKKEIMNLMFESFKYFEKNHDNETYYSFLNEINKLNQIIKNCSIIEHLIVCQKMIKDKVKEFLVLKKKLITL